MEVIEESNPVEKLEVNERTDCPTTPIDQELMNRTVSALLDESNKGKFLLWDQYVGGGDNPDDIRVVYVSQGVHYRVWHKPSLETLPPRLSVWESPNGTDDMDSLDTYTDIRMTGCVNFGIGSEASHGEDRRSMSWNDDIRDEEGLAHHAFWQGRYVFAIRGLADTLGVK